MEIEINGKALGLKFGLPALKRIIEKVGITEFTDQLSLTIIACRDILYSGYLNWCIAKDVSPSITAEELYNYIEDNINNQEEYAKINEAVNRFNESKYIKPSLNGQEKHNEEEKKS